MTEYTENTQKQTHAFQAEVKQILDIVINSLYTHRDIFVRELVSNSVDALEKMRHEKLTNTEIVEPDLPLEIRIDVNEQDNTFTITDTGVGMSEADLVENLGTIAHSGTREFIQQIAKQGKKDVELIGQFGVGFYSAFMVAKQVRVQTRSYQPGSPGLQWSSDGSGEYTIEPMEGVQRGTRVMIDLRDDAKDYASKTNIERIIKQYSNFVSFPIYLNGEKVNTIEALWTKNKKDIREEEYKEFYKFISNAFDEPMYTYHFSADVPLQINTILFVPTENTERFGFGQMEPGVNLYCRRVLIQQHSDAILPEWLRFVRGVVDSEDLPLNISRETFQDNAVVRKLKKVITTRFLKFLGEQAQADPEKYKTFWQNFGIFLKEGVTRDFEHREDIYPLLRFESSKEEPGKLIALDDYTNRMKAGQDSIYYINGPSREAIESGPYVEAFKKRDLEVIYVYDTIDDFVLNAIQVYNQKQIVSADQQDLNLPDVPEEEREESEEGKPKLSRDEVDSMTGWFKKILGDRVEAVRDSKRLVDSPAMIVNADSTMSTGMQKVMQNLNQNMGQIGRKTLEINPNHPLVVELAKRREAGDDAFLSKIVEQIYDNALVDAGLMDDPRSMVHRTYDIMEKALKGN